MKLFKTNPTAAIPFDARVARGENLAKMIVSLDDRSDISLASVQLSLVDDNGEIFSANGAARQVAEEVLSHGKLRRSRVHTCTFRQVTRGEFQGNFAIKPSHPGLMTISPIQLSASLYEVLRKHLPLGDTVDERARLENETVQLRNAVRGATERLGEAEELSLRLDKLAQRADAHAKQLSLLKRESEGATSHIKNAETSILETRGKTSELYREVEARHARISELSTDLDRLRSEVSEARTTANSTLSTAQEGFLGKVKELEEKYRSDYQTISNMAAKVSADRLKNSFEQALQSVSTLRATVAAVTLVSGAFAYLGWVAMHAMDNALVLFLRVSVVLFVAPIVWFFLREIRELRREQQSYRFKQAVLSSLPGHKLMLGDDAVEAKFAAKVMSSVYSSITPDPKNDDDGNDRQQALDLLDKALDTGGAIESIGKELVKHAFTGKKK